jgi:hypothetical protein
MTAVFLAIKEDISYYEKWYFLEETVIFEQVVSRKWVKINGGKKLKY